MHVSKKQDKERLEKQHEQKVSRQNMTTPINCSIQIRQLLVPTFILRHGVGNHCSQAEPVLPHLDTPLDRNCRLT